MQEKLVGYGGYDDDGGEYVDQEYEGEQQVYVGLEFQVGEDLYVYVDGECEVGEDDGIVGLDEVDEYGVFEIFVLVEGGLKVGKQVDVVIDVDVDIECDDGEC